MIEGLTPIPVENFGGLVTLPALSDLARGMSPDCQNVIFPPGQVRTREGLSVPFTAVGSVKFHSIARYATPGFVKRIMAFGSNGTLYKESPAGTLAVVRSGLVADSYMITDTLFGRLYCAFYNGRVGGDIPLSFDDDSVYRVSPEGPGAGPSLIDDSSLTTGRIPAGLHKAVCWFETATGYWTKCSPPVQWSAEGAKRVNITDIPTGPGWVKKRFLAFTTAGGESYYHVPTTMVIDNNTTTAVTLDFSLEELTAGELVDYLFRIRQVSKPLGVFATVNRLLWWSPRALMSSWRNLAFDGGFASGGEPLGWSQGTNFAGGSQETTDIVFGHAWRIQGNGTASIRGEITQAAFRDAWGGARQIRANTRYKVRARVRKSSGLDSGRLNIDLSFDSFNTSGLQVSASDATTDFAEYEGNLTAGLNSISTGLVLRVFTDETPTDGESFYVDEIEIFEAAEPWHASTVFVSKPFQPEALDAIEGLLQVARDDGHALRAMFSLNNLIYLIKERSIWVTEDNGVTEADGWTLRLVSPSVGTFSPRGVAVGEDWAIILSFDGVYLFDGSQPKPISDEIRPNWQRINWPEAHKSWVEVDLVAKRVYIGIPTGTATEPDRVLMLDYTEGFALEGFKAVQEGQAVTGRGRKWTTWTIPANAGRFLRRENRAARAMLFGNNVGNGKIYELDPAAFHDDGSAIDSYYRTGPVKASAAVLDLYGYLSAYVWGSGTLSIHLYQPDNSHESVTSHSLSNPADEDLERFLELEAERASVQFRTNSSGNWFALSKCVLWGAPHPMMPVRG